MNEPGSWMMIICVVVLGIVQWKSMCIMKAISLSGFRAQDRERGEYFRLLTQIIEKSHALGPQDTLRLAQIHAQENSNRMANDTEVEKTVVEAGSASNSPPDLFNSEAGDPDLGAAYR